MRPNLSLICRETGKSSANSAGKKSSACLFTAPPEGVRDRRHTDWVYVLDIAFSRLSLKVSALLPCSGWWEGGKYSRTLSYLRLDDCQVWMLGWMHSAGDVTDDWQNMQRASSQMHYNHTMRFWLCPCSNNPHNHITHLVLRLPAQSHAASTQSAPPSGSSERKR